MRTYYIKEEHRAQFELEYPDHTNVTAECACGTSNAYANESGSILVVVCDACYDAAPFIDRWY